MTMLSSPSKLTIGFALLAIVGRVLFFISTPVWEDYFNLHTSQIVNVTNSSNANHTPIAPLTPAHPTSHRISIIFSVVGQYGFSTIVFGIILLGLITFSPGAITARDRSHPKMNFFIIGFAQGVSAIMINFAVSGTRTAPYLQAILSNFGIPIQFVVRFIVLRKRPTCLKTLCAGAVVASEFVSLLPTIFPGLESSSQEQREGGATGPGRILWPICQVMSMVPYAIANSVMERSVQHDTPDTGQIQDTPSSEDESDSGPKQKHRVHLVYFLFWWCFFNTLTVASFFWVDFIPGFGTSSSFEEFGKTLLFNVQCLFGVGCGAEPALLGWLTFSSNLIGAVAFAGLMRYSEGASFVVIVLAMRTPIVFLFWTLFREQPLQWRPHVALSTWLSAGAILVMLPSIVIYNIGLPKMCCRRPSDKVQDIEPLIEDDSKVETQAPSHSSPRQV